MRLGEEGRVLFRVTGDEVVTEVTVDLLGDGMPGWSVQGRDLRAVGALWFRPGRAGVYQVQVRAVDECGRVDATGRARMVEVMPWP